MHNILRTGLVVLLCGSVAAICEDLTDAVGNATYVNDEERNTACWNIVCEEAVVVTMTHFSAYSRGYPYRMEYRTTAAGGQNRTLTYLSNWVGVGIALVGPLHVSFKTDGYWNSTDAGSQMSFEYRCAWQTETPPTLAPATLIPAPVQQCQGLNSVNQSAGEVEYVNADNTHTECWTIECEETVVIRMTSFGSSFLSSNRVSPYSVDFRSLSTGKNHSFDRHFNNWKGTDMVLRGPVFVTFVTSAYPSASSARSYLTFDYVCTTAETPAPSTDAPFAPGVDCDVHTVLTDAGNVSYAGNDTYYVECWEIACEHDVVLSFTQIQLYASSVDVYSSGNASGNYTGFVFERSVQTGGVEVVVSGPALVQFRSTIYAGTVWSYVDFSYECRAPTPPPQQQQCLGDTVPQRCGRGTSRACAFEVRHPARLLSVAFSGDGRRVATGAMDSVVRVFDARTGVQVSQLGCADFKVHDIAFSTDNNLVALAGDGGRVVVCNAATGVLEATLMDMSASGSTPVHRVEFTRDGRYAVSGGGSDSRTRIFDLLSSDMTNASSVLDHHARDVAFSVDGAHLATVRGTEVDEVTSVWTLDGTSAVELPSVGARVTALSFSSFGGNALLRGMSDGRILVSHLPGDSIGDGSAVDGVSLSMLSGSVRDSKFSRDGQKIAAVGEGDVMVWSHDGSVLHELLGHSRAVLSRLDFSPDGTRLATVSHDGTLVVWKL